MTTDTVKPLHERRILLGISGGIAAYKTPDLVRRLKEYGADVRCVMTSGAQAFITPLTLQAVSGYPVHHDLLDPQAEAAMGHIELAKWADLIVIAPASANTLARLANGMADDLLSTLCLASAAPIIVAPAMNQQMWANRFVQHNCSQLTAAGIQVISPASGAQACGDIGAGRMPEPLELREIIVAHFAQIPTPFVGQALAGKSVVITAGPTREAIDPVRYLSNHSSGKMGFALAAAAQAMGAKVTLVAGPVNLSTPNGVTRVDVTSAAQMHAAVMQAVESADIFIGCAAVADYRPEHIADNKIKKSNDGMQITLVRNPDILADVAARAQAPFTIGFAAETNDVAHYAQDKLQRKKLSMIAANDVSDTRIGFNSEDNAMFLFWRDAHNAIQQKTLPRANKLTIAQQILEHAATLITSN